MSASSAASGGYRFAAAALSDVGYRRELNEDSLLCLPQDGIFAVADGMGGHEGGEVASAACVQTLAAGAERFETSGQRPELNDLRGLLGQANIAVLDSGHARSGTTLTMLCAVRYEGQEQLAVCNVGDSRTYYYETQYEQLTQVTEDHSAVQELVNEGLLTPELARTHPDWHVITRALGMQVEMTADVAVLSAVVGDRFLLCSDGLSSELEDEEIAALLKGPGDLQEIAQALINQALDAGGHDNVTAVVVEILETPETD